MTASTISKPTKKKYSAITVGSFEKEYGLKLVNIRNSRMHLATHMKNNGLPHMAKLLKAVEKILANKT